MAPLSKKFFELVDGQPSVASNAAHCESVDWVVPWNRHDANTVRHNDMSPLAHHAEAGLFESADRIEVIHARNFGTSHRHFTYMLAFDKVVYGGEVFTDRVLDICQSFVFGVALRPATWQAWTRNAEAFL
jgi:hypothetical protein